LIGVLGGGFKAQSSGREGRRGSGMEPFEKALMSSYRHNFSTIFTRIRDIATFVLLHTTFPSDTPIVSSDLPHIPLEVGRWPLCYEKRRCWRNFPCS